MLLNFSAHSQVKLDDFGADGTLLRHQITDKKYILIGDPVQTDALTISQVTLKQVFLHDTSFYFTIDLFNIIYDKEYLSVFSVLPSLKSTNPSWRRISLDSIKTEIINVDEFKTKIISEIHGSQPNQPGKTKGYNKYWNYSVIKKEKDGYYCSTSDCLTELFMIRNNQHNKSVSSSDSDLNLHAPLLSIAEYEIGYMRKFNEYSGNSKWSESVGGGWFQDRSNVPIMNLSYVKEFEGKKAYQFWLLDHLRMHSNNANRGMNRFVYVPTIGVVGASYDYYLPLIAHHWGKKQSPGKFILDNIPFLYPYHTGFSSYLLEEYIKPFKINNRLIKY